MFRGGTGVCFVEVLGCVSWRYWGVFRGGTGVCFVEVLGCVSCSKLCTLISIHICGWMCLVRFRFVFTSVWGAFRQLVFMSCSCSLRFALSSVAVVTAIGFDFCRLEIVSCSCPLRLPSNDNV